MKQRNSYRTRPSMTCARRKFFTRLAFVLTLVLLTTLAPALVFRVVRAQNGETTRKSAHVYVAGPDAGSSFIIYQTPDGHTNCRTATPDEARALRSGTNSNGLRQINHRDTISTDAADTGGITPQSTTGLTIILRATPQLDANPTAKAAFIAAAAKWEALIKDPITINIDVDYGTTAFGTPFSDSNVLGATSTQELFFNNNYPTVRRRLINHATGTEGTLYNALPATSVPTDLGAVNTVLVSSPILRALGEISPVASDSETFGAAPRIGFNSAFGFDFDPSDGITSSLTDFDAVATHEIGHALGFGSEVGARELDATQPLFVTIWDFFRVRPGTATAGNFSTVQRILSSGGEQVEFNGASEVRLATGKPDGTGGDGDQASHWKDDFQNGGVFIGIMDPAIPRGRRETMTVNDQKAIDLFGYTITATVAPANDNFVNAQAISGNSGTLSGTNAFATQETGEPVHSPDGVASGKSVWYRWIAPNSGTATFTTAGSNFDTLLAVYTGASVGGLTTIVKNDDMDTAGGIYTSSVQFAAVGGTTYQIAVDGYGGDQGSITLNWSLPGATPTPTPIPTPTPGPNVTQFSVGTASATETPNATTKVTLNVTRSGDTAAAATVSYATSDGSASERSDYIVAVGTLRFAANETTKPINVFIVNDAYGEGPESFNITLSSPVGTALGSPSAVTVTINSDESVNGANPVNPATFDTDFYVRQQYLDFLNREPDASGLNFWKNEIDSCGADPACREVRRINVSAAFFLSIEFQQTGYLVYRANQSAFNTGETLRQREFLADTQEIGRGVIVGQPGFEQVLEANKQKFFADFVVRAPFLVAYPTTMTAAAFVDNLNANTFDPRNPTSGGSLTQSERDALVNQLAANPASATLRAQVLRSVSENALFSQRQTNKAFVLMQYFGYLRRNPNDTPDTDFSGYNFWLSKLNQFNGNFVQAEMVKAFIGSTEYQLRFGP